MATCEVSSYPSVQGESFSGAFRKSAKHAEKKTLFWRVGKWQQPCSLTVVHGPIGHANIERRQNVIGKALYVQVLLHLLVVLCIAHWLTSQWSDQIIPPRGIDTGRRPAVITKKPVILVPAEITSGEIIVRPFHHVVHTPIHAVPETRTTEEEEENRVETGKRLERFPPACSFFKTRSEQCYGCFGAQATTTTTTITITTSRSSLGRSSKRSFFSLI
jgi:hypothetical protein